MITEGQYLDAIHTVREYLKQTSSEININSTNHLPILDTKMNSYDLPLRLLNALNIGRGMNYTTGEKIKSNIITVRDLVKSNKREILRFRHFGAKSMSDLEKWMDANKLEFGMLTKQA